MSASKQIRVRLPPRVAKELAGLSPRVRAGVVSALLVVVIEKVDLVALLLAVEELRKLSVFLDQLLQHSSAQGGLDATTVARVQDVVALIEKLRGRS